MFTDEELGKIAYFKNKIAYQGDSADQIFSAIDNILSNAEIELGSSLKEFKSVRKGAIQFCQSQSQRFFDFAADLKEFSRSSKSNDAGDHFV
jgi:hypothetical protein